MAFSIDILGKASKEFLPLSHCSTLINNKLIWPTSFQKQSQVKSRGCDISKSFWIIVLHLTGLVFLES
jgi:hypothetical protein